MSCPVLAVAQTPPPINNNVAVNNFDLSTIRSLFFSESEITAINNARASYDQRMAGVNNNEEDDFLKNLEKVKISDHDANSLKFTYPQFYLSSIAYYGASNWVVWVNEEKITQDSGISASGLKVIEINKERVVFEWKPQRMDKIVDVGEASSDGVVKTDFARGKLNFELHPNQTFSSYAMRVAEGKLAPVTINNDTSP